MNEEKNDEQRLFSLLGHAYTRRAVVFFRLIELTIIAR
jgi:hypothetical protein